MSNNDVLKKLRVALQLRDEDIVKILALVDFRISISEVNAFFRKEDQPNYREAGDQVLRNFLNGLVIHLRGPKPDLKTAVPTPQVEAKKKKPEFPSSEGKTGLSKKEMQRPSRPTKGNRDFPGAKSDAGQPKTTLRKRRPKA